MTSMIEHDGKGMPVDGATRVGVRLRDGSETPAGMFFPASGWGWRWEDEYAPEAHQSGDIVAYQIADQQETTA